MMLFYVVYALGAVSGVVARAVLGVAHAQVPLLVGEGGGQRDAKTRRLGVAMACRRSGKEGEVVGLVPLREAEQGMGCFRFMVCTLIRSVGAMMQEHWGKPIETMRILWVENTETKVSVSLEELSRVKCRLEAEFSAEEVSAATASGVELGVWPSFGFGDGTIWFDREESRWFLAGRSIKNVECW